MLYLIVFSAEKRHADKVVSGVMRTQLLELLLEVLILRNISRVPFA